MTTYQREARRLREDICGIRIRAVAAFYNATTDNMRVESDRIWNEAYGLTAKAEALIALANQLSPSVGRRRSKRVITR